MYISKDVSPEVARRQAIEIKILEATIDAALAAGFSLGVYDGDDIAIDHSTDRKAILDAAYNSDDDRLLFRVPKGSPSTLTAGWVQFIYGNDGYDVMSDYTTNLEPHLKPVMDMVERMERGEAA